MKSKNEFRKQKTLRNSLVIQIQQCERQCLDTAHYKILVLTSRGTNVLGITYFLPKCK